MEYRDGVGVDGTGTIIWRKGREDWPLSRVIWLIDGTEKPPWPVETGEQEELKLEEEEG